MFSVRRSFIPPLLQEAKMKKPCIPFLIILVATAAVGNAQQAAPLRLVETIPLPNVEGRIDHFGVDVEGHRLFVSGLGNNTVEVLDLSAGKRVQSMGGLAEPQGILYVPEFDEIFVANARDGKCRILDGRSFQPIGTVDFGDDADNIRYDRAAKLVYVGYGDGALGIIDPKNGRQLGDIKLEGHPESFQLEALGSRIFVNVPTAGHIAVIERASRAVVAKWPLGAGRDNFPMTLDEANRRLFVTCRKPPEVLAFDTTSGKQIASLPVVGDADDMFYDSSHHRIYVSGGEGFLSVLE
jgi:DNA-binding beta-propeller fold protein YncE